MDVKAKFGEDLRAARAAAGMTQEDLAHGSGVGLRFLKYMESGIKQPSLTTLYRLAGALGTTPQELVGPSWEAWQKESEE